MHTCANPDTRQVVFILAPSYSGSSLLGNVLGAHPAALHIGEVVSTLQRGKGVRCRLYGELGDLNRILGLPVEA